MHVHVFQKKKKDLRDLRRPGRWFGVFMGLPIKNDVHGSPYLHGSPWVSPSPEESCSTQSHQVVGSSGLAVLWKFKDSYVKFKMPIEARTARGG